MARTITSISVVGADATSLALTMSYSGTYDWGLNECGAEAGLDGFVRTFIESRNVTTAGAWTTVTTLDGGTTGATSYTATGLTTGNVYEFRASSYQRRRIEDEFSACVPDDSATTGPVTSNQQTVYPLVSASLAATLGAATVVAAAGVRVGATLTKTLDASTVSASATHPVTGSLVQTLTNTTLSSNVTHPVTGSLSRTLGAATLSASLRVAIRATLAQTLGAAQGLATAAVRVTVTASIDLGAATLASEAVQPWWRVSPTPETWSSVPATSETWTPVPTNSTVWN